MKNNTSSSQTFTRSKWLRFSASFILASLSALILFFIPMTIGLKIAIPAPDLSNSSPTQGRVVNLSVPFGTTLIHAANGITVTKSAATTVDQGGILIYTLTFTNGSPNPVNAGEILIIENAPANTTINCPSVSTPSGWFASCSPASNNVAWAPSSPVASGVSVDFAVGVTVDQPLPDQSLVVNDDYSLIHNSVSEPGTPVSTLVNAPSWAINKTVSSSTIQPNQILVYTITVTNIGHLATSGNYVISDTLPNDTTLVSAPGATGSSILNWTFSNALAALGGSRTVTYSVLVNSPLPTGLEIRNDDYAVSGGSAFASATGAPVIVTVNSPADLSVTKTASSNPVKIGQTFTYTLTITNTSLTGQATGVVLTDTLPGEVTFQSAAFISGASGTITATGGNPIIWTFNNPLGPGASAQVRVTAQVDNILLPTPAVITNNFEASADNAVTISGARAIGIAAGEPILLTVSTGSTNLDICETTLVTALVEDSVGNPVPNAPVSLSTIGAAAANTTILPPDSGVTDANGLFTATAKVISNPPLSATFRIFGETGVEPDLINDTSPFINVSEIALPDELTLTVAPNPLYTGAKTAVVTATLQTCEGTPVAGETITFDLDSISLASFPGPSASDSDVTDSNGRATATLTSTSTQTINGVVTITGAFGALQDVITLDVEPEPMPALAISKTANPSGGSNVLPESVINYTIVVTNTGNGNATNVVLTDTLPAGVGFVGINSSTNGGAGTIGSPTFPASNVLVLPLSFLEPNRTLAATIQVTVTAGVSGTVLSNVANAKSNTTPVITSNIVVHRVITPTTTASNVYLPIVLK